MGKLKVFCKDTLVPLFWMGVFVVVYTALCEYQTYGYQKLYFENFYLLSWTVSSLNIVLFPLMFVSPLFSVSCKLLCNRKTCFCVNFIPKKKKEGPDQEEEEKEKEKEKEGEERVKNEDDNDSEKEELNESEKRRKRTAIKTISKIWTSCFSCWFCIPFSSLITGVVVLCPLLYFAQYSWLVSLQMTPPSINMAVYQFMNVVIVILSIFLLWKETRPFLIIKCIILLACIGSVILIAFGGVTNQEEAQYPHTSIGILLAIFSSIIYAAYDVFFAKIFGVLNFSQIVFIQVVFGVFIMCTYWIGIPILNVMNIERVDTLTSYKPSKSLFFLISGSLIYVFFYLLNCIILSSTQSPIYAGMAQIVVIVTCTIWDCVVSGIKLSWKSLVGIIIIIIASIIMNFVQFLPEKYDCCLVIAKSLWRKMMDVIFVKKKKKEEKVEEKNEVVNKITMVVDIDTKNSPEKRKEEDEDENNIQDEYSHLLEPENERLK